MEHKLHTFTIAPHTVNKKMALMCSLLYVQIVDNGLIVFTKENEDKLVYSYPYPQFTGSEEIMCVAPFWADAIINKNGEVYYHVSQAVRREATI